MPQGASRVNQGQALSLQRRRRGLNGNLGRKRLSSKVGPRHQAACPSHSVPGGTGLGARWESSYMGNASVVVMGRGRAVCASGSRGLSVDVLLFNCILQDLSI